MRNRTSPSKPETLRSSTWRGPGTEGRHDSDRDGQDCRSLGANGAGKTTTLRAMTALLDIHNGRLTKGEVLLNGQSIRASTPPS